MTHRYCYYCATLHDAEDGDYCPSCKSDLAHGLWGIAVLAMGFAAQSFF
jgi:hypothetical protein